jgi:hypothetical protein
VIKNWAVNNQMKRFLPDDKLFEKYDTYKSGMIGFDDFKSTLIATGSRFTSIKGYFVTMSNFQSPICQRMKPISYAGLSIEPTVA